MGEEKHSPGVGVRVTTAIGLSISATLEEVLILKLSANTYQHERVHAFPDVVDFGTLRQSDLSHVGATLMVHQEGGSDFQVQPSTDVPGMSLRSERDFIVVGGLSRNDCK
jgi:hypothetical protein